jgi:hypothetical protein
MTAPVRCCGWRARRAGRPAPWRRWTGPRPGGRGRERGSSGVRRAAWAGQRQIYFTRSRPYKKNDQATIESKNNHLVRRYGFYYRYDTPAELQALNRLWPLVNDRLNYFTPTKKPIGWDADRNGRRRRIYDTPTTPLDRLLAARVLAPAQEQELLDRRAELNPVDLARRIHDEQQLLIKLAKDKTDQLREATAKAAKKLPDTGRGVRPRETS